MDSESPRKLRIWFVVLSLLVGVLVVVAYYKDQFRSWKTYQHQYIQDQVRRGLQELLVVGIFEVD